MHVALYRKYRPKTFSQVKGQKYVVEALKNQIAAGKIGHAFIFTGTRGTGKTSCAKIFAKAVNCLHPINGEPCLECDVCKGIENESIYDVTEMDAASNNSVDDIRDVLDEVNYLPVMAKYRVYIIDEVHMLSPAAFNALLKTLEEPPAHVIFILATTEIHKVPATILSRCQRYDFSKLNVDDIAQALMDISQQENFQLTEGAAKMIASLSDGAMRDANSILDTCVSAGGIINEDTVANIAGVSKDDDILAFVQSLIEKDMPSALGNLAVLSSRSVDMKRLCEELITHLGNLMLANLTQSTPQLLNISREKFGKLKNQAKTCSHNFISYALGCFTTALENMSKGQNAKVAMDVAVFTLCTPAVPSTAYAYTQSAYTANTSQRQEKTTNRENNTQTVPSAQSSQIVQPNTTVTTVENATIQADTADIKLNNQPLQTENMSVEAPQDDSDNKPVNNTQQQAVSPQNNLPIPQEFEYWQEVIDIIADVDVPLHSFMKSSTAFLYENIVYIKGNEGLNKYIRTNKEVNRIIKSAILKACGRSYNIGGFKNIAHYFAHEEHSSINDIQSLQQHGVQVNIIDD